MWCRNSLLSPNKFTEGGLIKIKWLVTDVTAVRSPDRAEHAILGVILAGCVLLPIHVIFVVGGPLCGVGTPS